jgi:uncharacterized protein (DUF924 family)
MERLHKVLDFWFGSAGGDGEISDARQSLWFGKDPETDRRIEQQFGALVRQAVSGACREWIASARDRLAVIILLDQFTRNIYRDQPQSFAGDPQALQLALEGLAAGEDRQLQPIERVFLYLPLEHAEQPDLQERSVELFTALAREVPEAQRQVFSGHLDYAIRHRDIIARFGRFPHRNKMLGRGTTPEEAEFLTRPGSSF